LTVYIENMIIIIIIALCFILLCFTKFVWM